MASLISSIIGAGQQGSADDQAKATQAAALAAIQGINVPTIAEQEVQLAQEKSAGQLNPAMEGTVNAGNTGLSNISVDPRLRAAQMQALSSLQQQGQTGLTATDREALNQISNQQAQQANSANQAVLQNMAQRGMGGSGASLAAQLANNQNAANNSQQRSLQVGAQAQQNALNATAQSGQLGSQLEGQQYGQAANAANAQDAINRFNAANQQNVLGQNTQNKNVAQQYNLSNAQNIGNTNVGLQNQQQFYNKGLYQQQFQNNLSKAMGAAGESNSLAGSQQLAGKNANANTQAIGAGVNSAGSQGASFFAYDGGMVPSYADGGQIDPNSTNEPSLASRFQNFFAAGLPQKPQQPQAAPAQAPANPDVISALLSKLKTPTPQGQLPVQNLAATQANNYGAPKLQMPSMYPQQQQAPAFAMGGSVNYQQGGPVRGPEIVPGDSPRNDVVDAKLSGGEIVVPKEVAQHSNDDVIMAFIKGVKTANKRK